MGLEQSGPPKQEIGAKMGLRPITGTEGGTLGTTTVLCVTAASGGQER